MLILFQWVDCRSEQTISLSTHAIFIPQTRENEITTAVNMSRLSSWNIEPIPGIQSTRPSVWLHRFTSRQNKIMPRTNHRSAGRWKTTSVLCKHNARDKHKLHLVSKKRFFFLFEFVSCFLNYSAAVCRTHLMPCVKNRNKWNMVKHFHLLVKRYTSHWTSRVRQ